MLAHWQTVKPAYRVTLADGTQLISSGDHRFLSDRGWKHVVGAESGPLQRPHLTTSNKLMGVGSFAEPPKAGAGYQRGYLCGMIRGDGTIHEGRHQRADGSMYHLRQFRLALTDQEALERSRTYLSRLGVAGTEFIFTDATATRRQLAAIRCGGLDNVAFIRGLISWPDEPSLDWRKGFLAGVFDAEGSYSRGILRISSTDPEELMPPRKSGKRLTPPQIELLKAWIDQGASWSKHWAFDPPLRTSPPAVKARDWPKNAIDAFVLARLEAEKLTPSADCRG